MPIEPSIAVLMTCFNRREKTLAALASLASQTAEIPRRLQVILVDDASTDGTAQAVAAQFPQVRVIAGSGSLFWNGGMRVAFAEALRTGFDYFLWLNDDTQLFPDALDTLLRTAEELERRGVLSIVTGSTRDAVTGLRTYGGRLRVYRWNGVQDLPVQPLENQPAPCDTMNGNCTLVPAAIAAKIGNLEGRFHHHFGDFDYGLRARQAGFAVHVAPGYIGTCSINSQDGTWRDGSATFRQRWKHLMSPKGSPFAEWFLFSSRHYGYLWPLYFLSPYAKTFLKIQGIRKEAK